jgi:hypothetical protein
MERKTHRSRKERFVDDRVNLSPSSRHLEDHFTAKGAIDATQMFCSHLGTFWCFISELCLFHDSKSSPKKKLFRNSSAADVIHLREMI